MAANTATQSPVKLTLSYKVVWGIAALGLSTISGTFGALQPIFNQDYLGLEARWIGIAAVIYALWNAINDPMFGYITDNTRSKRGRRIPYMRFTAPFLALTFILVWLALLSCIHLKKYKNFSRCGNRLQQIREVKQLAEPVRQR